MSAKGDWATNRGAEGAARERQSGGTRPSWIAMRRTRDSDGRNEEARREGDGAGPGGEERKRAVRRYSNVLATMPRIIKRRESRAAISLVAIRIRSYMMPRHWRHRWWWPDMLPHWRSDSVLIGLTAIASV